MKFVTSCQMFYECNVFNKIFKFINKDRKVSQFGKEDSSNQSQSLQNLCKFS